MASYKNVNGDYTLTAGGNATITVNGGNGKVTVNGDLDVFGNITYVDELEVNDAFIVVAGNNTGAITSMGLVAQTGNTSFAGLRYNSVSNVWQISTAVNVDGSPIGNSYANIATSAANTTVAGSNTQVQFNDSMAFGATANLTFDKTTNKLTISNGQQVLGNVASAPTQTANAVAIYNAGVGAGATGLYVIGTNGANTVTSNDELISLTRARLFAIIF